MTNQTIYKSTVNIMLWMCIIYFVGACTPATVATDPIADIKSSPIANAQKTPTTTIVTSEITVTDNNHSTITPLPTSTMLLESEIYETDATMTSATPQEPDLIVLHSAITNKEADQYLIELLEDNGGCDLPCWGGIVPGKTYVDNIGETFVPKGFSWYREINNTNNGGADLESNSMEYKGLISITEKEGIVEIIEVDGGTRELTKDQNEAWEWYSIPEILRRYGKPDKILVLHPFRYDDRVPASYNLYMLYESKGFVIRYHGSVEYLDEPGMVRACPDITKTNVLNLLLYQPNENLDALDYVLPEEDVVFKTPGDNVYDAIAWETVTGLSLDDFYDLFTNSEVEMPPCFDFQTYWTS